MDGGAPRSGKVPAPGKGAHGVRCVRAGGAQWPPGPGQGVAWLLCAHEGRRGPWHTLGGMASRPRSSGHRPGAGNPGLGSHAVAGGGAFPSRDTSSNSSPARAPSRTRGSKHRDVIRVRLRLPLRSPRRGGRAPLRSGPGLCPGFPPSRAGRQGGQRRESGPESPRKGGLRLFSSRTEVRSSGCCPGQRECRLGVSGGVQVRRGPAEQSGREASACSSPSWPEANLASSGSTLL